MGNICRSPMAETILHRKVTQRGLDEQYTIDSAGTYAGHEGEPADPRMRRAAATRGYNITHRARPLTEQDFQKFDMIIVMDDRNLDDALCMASSLEDYAKVSRMADYSICGGFDHIPDPYCGGSKGFEDVIDMLEDCCEGLLLKLNSDMPQR